MADTIKTRILIISDTHRLKPHIREPGDDEGYDTETEITKEPLKSVATGYRHPLPPADVMLHCGDLTLRSTLEEYKDTFDAIREAPAKLKIVIAGNHDLSLDDEFYKLNEDIMESSRKAKTREVRRLIEEAKADGVVYLEEGTHEFDLENGARLKVYASPWTPLYGGWAFQYETEVIDEETVVGHKFDIPEGVDVAMTHGPPRGILDYAGMDGVKAGCDWLFDSVRKVRPRIHCFGHIHEAWGAYLATWKEDGREGDHKRKPESVDEEASKTIMKQAWFWPSQVNKQSDWTAKMDLIKRVSKQRGVTVDTTEGPDKLEPGKQTLFINAAIMDIRYRPVQAPWLVDIDLPRART